MNKLFPTEANLISLISTTEFFFGLRGICGTDSVHSWWIEHPNSKAVVYFDSNINFDEADGVIINLEGGGECNYIDECHERCDRGNRLCKARTEPQLQMRGGIWSRENENPFANFFKIFHPYCSSDIHQGSAGPS